MHTAAAVKPDFWTPLRQWVHALWPEARKPAALRPSPMPSSCRAPQLIAARALSTGASAEKCMNNKPLRVVRVVESGQARTAVGRMVISGRMADVCAELDRLAASEAA
ncbi:hypothetical protein [uncultured Rhodoferax sp.]|uniref:hypothetical protein n=1 Tax=uncultured Rhodoferax sp. TaxID=223188 RepID=UPI0025DF773A|nr:hypothetical protein [uncultured Rhodoferax sp.]